MLKKNINIYLFIFLYILNFILIKSDDADDIQNLKNSLTSTSYTIAKLNEDGGITDDCNSYYMHLSYIDKQAITKNGIDYPKVELNNDCINNKLKAEGKKILISVIFRFIEYSSTDKNYLAGIKKLIDIVSYQLYYIEEEATDTSNLENINIITKCGNVEAVYYMPIISEEALKSKFISVIGQNPDDNDDYNIFNPDDEIYSDICKTITYSVASESVDGQDSFNNYDITLHERRKYYYPGDTELCPSSFNLLGIDKETFSAKCQTNVKDYSGGGESGYDLHDEFGSYKSDSDFKKAKRDIYFSMTVLKCISLPFTKRGFKDNWGSFFILILIFIVLACYLILLLTGKYHLLSVLELLYNSNIKSMNYIKRGYNPNTMYNPQTNNSNNQIPIPYEIRSSNNLAASHQTTLSNGQLLNNFLTGNSHLYQPNYEKLSVNKNSANKSSTSQNNIKKNEKDKKDLMSNVDEQENDAESEKDNDDKDKTNIINDSKDVDIINKNKDGNVKEKKSAKEEDKGQENESDNEEDDEDNENSDESESNQSYKNKIKKDSKNKANPPKKKNGGDDTEEENGKKKKKAKNPIEISLNVKDLREMMFKDQIPVSENKKIEDKKEKENDNRSKSKKGTVKKKKRENSSDNINTNMPQNGFPPYPFMPPMGMMPYGMPPPYPYLNNNGGDHKNDETQNLKRELEYQRELNERREREMRREREEMMEKERERQRQRDYDYERERRLRDMEMRYINSNNGDPFENKMTKLNNVKGGYKRGSALWNEDSDDILIKEREKFYQEQDKFIKEKEKLENELKKKNEENAKLQNDVNIAREELKSQLTGHENELLKKNQELREQFEKEKKEIIEAKDREIQLLREDKDREIQRLKEDKDREIQLLKEDMTKEIKKKDEKIKKKEKVIEKQKRETVELKKDLTTNTFYTNNMNMATQLKQQMEANAYLKESEKIEAPQVVVPITSIFTDQELNALDFEESCQYDKRSLCQVYLSFINRKQPLFFLFNYNSSSSGISVFQINFQSLRFIIICIDFMIYLFIYCTFFGTKTISQIYFRIYNFRRMCILGSIISPFCLIIRSVIHHFIYDPMNKKIAEIKMRCYTNFIIGKKKEELKVNEFREFWESYEGDEPKNKDNLDKKDEIDEIQDIENDDNLTEEEKMRRKDKYEKKLLKALIKQVISIFQKKLFFSFVILIVCMFFEWMYIASFCAVYKNSQLQFFLSLLVCYGFANLIPVVYCLVPTIFKQDAVRDESKFSYFLANLFQII